MRRILCLGDSNTYGFDPRSYIGARYSEGIRWTSLIRNPETEVINCGENGLCIPGEYRYPVYRVLLKRYVPISTIIIMLGSNDLLAGTPLTEISDKMAGFVQMIRDSAPDSDIILVSPPHMQLGEWVQSHEIIKRSSELGSVYKAIADRFAIRFADAEEWHVSLTYDGVHFSEDGHRAFAAGVLQSLPGNKTEELSPPRQLRDSNQEGVSPN